MKVFLTYLIFLLYSLVARGAEPAFDFDGESYIQTSSSLENNIERYEYLRVGDNQSAWEKMLTIQIHHGAENISDVMNPYAAALQNFYLDEPKIYSARNPAGETENVFEFLVISPDQSSAEFSLVRAVPSAESAILLYIFSLRIPNTTEGIDRAVSEIERKRLTWLNALASAPNLPVSR